MSPLSARKSVRPSSRLLSIDVLRGCAVLLVLVSHLPFSMSSDLRDVDGPNAFPSSVVLGLGLGHVGVHLFLVISGFCIHLQGLKHADAPLSFIDFWRRRLRRLYPPYFVALLCTILGLFAVYHHAPGAWPSKLGYSSMALLATDLVLLLTLTQNLDGASQRIGNGPFWTLALEEQLYLLYFPLRALRNRMRWSYTLFVVGALTLAWRCATPLLGLTVPWLALGPARWFDWVLGAYAAEAFSGRISLPKWCRSPSLGATLLACSAALDLNRAPLFDPLRLALGDATFAVSFFVLVNFATSREERCREIPALEWLATIGVWSYSLYLTHEPVMVLAKQLGFAVKLGVAGVTLLRLVLPLLAAYIFHRLVEWRFMGKRRA